MPGSRCPLPALPVLRWLPRYSRAWLPLDVLAGLAVGLTAVPQALAYAELAGLPLQYGLYSSFMGCFVYCLLGTAKDVTLGPTAIMSLLVSSYAFQQPAYAVLLAFLSGCIQLAMGLLRLGFLLDFISCPVIKGFTSAASITISFNQVKNILGLQGIPRQFFLQLYETLRRIGETRAGDAVLGLSCLAALAGLRAMKSHLPQAVPTAPLAVRISHLVVWICATARNALVVLFAGLVAYSFQVMGCQPFRLTGSIPQGLPPFRPPPFSLAVPNGTVPFPSMLQPHRMATGLTPARSCWLWDSSECPVRGLHPRGRARHRCPGPAVPGIPDLSVLLHPQSSAGCCHHLGRGAHVRRWHLPEALAGSEAGPCAPVCDVPAVFLGGAVWNRGWGAGFWPSPAPLHCQTPNKGVRGGRAAGAAGEQPALPSCGAPEELGVQPCSGSIPGSPCAAGLQPRQQHRLHSSAGAGRAAAGAAQARPLAGLLCPAGARSPSPPVCRLRRIPAFPQQGGGRGGSGCSARMGALQGAGGQQDRAPHQPCPEHRAHPVTPVWPERPVPP
uniref:Solute carrier family 26 member 11 n=1 Tax=Junco hyemalis TaxID=40217 RepID=A0A8C5IRP9_JUNHY